MKQSAMRILKSPFLHFLIIGGGLYWGYSVLTAQEVAPEPDNTIRVTNGEVQWLRDSWEKRWRRQPTKEEFQGVLDEYIRETVFYREAIRLGLDKNDTIVRRRLAQKLEFLFRDLSAMKAPREQELQAYFESNQAQYQEPEVMTFTNVFIDPDRRGDKTISDAKTLLAKLKTLKEPTQKTANLGDPFMLQNYYPSRNKQEISKLFGTGFADSLFGLPAGKWHGPVLSGYGTHLVYVHDRTMPPPPEFTKVRGRVLQDWRDAKRRRLYDDQCATLLKRYDVVVEGQETE
jgi:peptidyl-prolyl cis-trans isomerase C